MLVVKVEMHSAITGHNTLLGSMIIGNRGDCRDPRRGNYDIAVARKPDAADLSKVWAKPLRKGTVEDYPRLSYNVWRLVMRALASAFPEEPIKLPEEGSVDHEDAMEREAHMDCYQYGRAP